MPEPITIDPFKIKRTCEPSIDPSRLTLSDDVRQIESIHSMTLVELADLEIPTASRPNIEQNGLADHEFPWDVYMGLRFREDWAPDAYGLGDLIETLSLLPNEEITLEVKTWETSKTQQDSSEELDDKNTSDIKTTRSDASEIASENAKKTHEYVDASAGYSGFGVSVSVKAGYSQDVSNLQKNLAKTKQDQSQRRASELRSTRKSRLAISREAGSESKSTRKLKNINQTQTLNVNFFSLLRRYKVSHHRTGASLIMAGPPVSMGASGGSFEDPDGELGQLRLGQLLQVVTRPGAVERMTAKAGESPIAVIRGVWAAELQWLAEALWIVDAEAKARFLRTIHGYLRPLDTGWMVVDAAGRHRWAYEVVPGAEETFLKFLAASSRVRVPAEPVPGMVGDAQIANPFPGNGAITQSPLIEEVIGAEDVIAKVLTPLRTLDAEERIDEWTVVLPSPGMHADLSLGICSGAEDYFEAQRYFDLETKRLEIEKLKLELERLKLNNAAVEQGEPTVRVSAEDPTTSVNIDIDAKDAGANVKIGDG